MPWETERHCYDIYLEWGVWDYSDKLLQSFVHDNILLYPLQLTSFPEGQNRVTQFLDSDPKNQVVLFSFIDVSIDVKRYHHDRVHVLDTGVNIVSFWEYFLSHMITDFGVTEPNYVNDFLCYQRKPNHHRPQVYDALKDRNGVVTIGTQEFAINSNLTWATIDKDYNPNISNPGDIFKVEPEFNFKVYNDITTLGNIDVWNDSFLIIVSETFGDPTGYFYSEKTFKPMMGKRPFITLGANDGYYQGLRDKGYHTFENDFPRYYQRQVDEYAVELADYLITMDQRSYYQDNKQKFDDNYENLKSAIDRNTQSLRNYLSQLIA